MWKPQRERERERETWMFPGESIPYARSLAIDMCCSFRLAKKEIMCNSCAFCFSLCYGVRGLSDRDGYMNEPTLKEFQFFFFYLKKEKEKKSMVIEA
jgi:hypothetical protein